MNNQSSNYVYAIFVADLGYKITLDYVIPAFYSSLSGMKEEVSESPRIRNILSYRIGPH